MTVMKCLLLKMLCVTRAEDLQLENGPQRMVAVSTGGTCFNLQLARPRSEPQMCSVTDVLELSKHPAQVDVGLGDSPQQR